MSFRTHRRRQSQRSRNPKFAFVGGWQKRKYGFVELVLVKEENRGSVLACKAITIVLGLRCRRLLWASVRLSTIKLLILEVVAVKLLVVFSITIYWQENSSMAKKKVASKAETEKEKPLCGIVMPISEIDGCDEKHWEHVLSIIQGVLDECEYESKLVSESSASGIIQKEIVNNLHDAPMVIVDISCQNPNVMIELGIRLTFDKPTIIIKDDKLTKAPFDVASIRYVSYPRSLYHPDIEKFKSQLKKAVKETAEAAEDPNYSVFLKNYGKFEVPKLSTQELSLEEFGEKLIDRVSRIVNNSQQSFSASSESDISNKKVSDDDRRYPRRVLFRFVKNFITDNPDLGDDLLPDAILFEVAQEMKWEERGIPMPPISDLKRWTIQAINQFCK